MLDDRGNHVAPGSFVPAAERYGLMPQIDRWVVRTALAHLAARGERARPELCSINLSGTSVADPHMLPFIHQQFDAHGVAPSRVCFEITETAAMTDLTSAVRFVERLQGIGCRIALDDFGSGMWSFTYLKHLGVDYVKIDGSFVAEMRNDAVATALVESINTVGHAVGALTVAEFVEDQATLDRLTAIGVDYAQGFELARPRPLAVGESYAVSLPATAMSDELAARS